MRRSTIDGMKSATPEEIEEAKRRGERIRKRRWDELRLTQNYVAERVGITQPTLSALERGETIDPEAGTLLGIAAVLQTSPYLLMYDHVPPEAMQHTVAALVDIWDRLDEKQRLQVVAYAQGLVDSSAAARKGPPSRQAPVVAKHSRKSH